MPTPHKGQTQKEFISVCMGYPDMQKYDDKQRAAICFSKWQEHLKNKANEWLGETDHDNTESKE